jgi:hypothetical protein
MASISSSEKPASARDAVHDGGRPTNLGKVYERDKKRKRVQNLPFVDMRIVLTRMQTVSIKARENGG